MLNKLTEWSGDELQAAIDSPLTTPAARILLRDELAKRRSSGGSRYGLRTQQQAMVYRPFLWGPPGFSKSAPEKS